MRRIKNETNKTCPSCLKGGIKMIIPRKLEIGDTIGVVAPSDPIIGKNIGEIMRAREILEKDGFKVKFSKNLFSNTCGYSATAKEKAEDINDMFQDKDVKMIWCAKGGNNSNSVFEYLDYNVIKNNPKIVCGYSDITSLTNMISILAYVCITRDFIHLPKYFSALYTGTIILISSSIILSPLQLETNVNTPYLYVCNYTIHIHVYCFLQAHLNHTFYSNTLSASLPVLFHLPADNNIHIVPESLHNLLES